MWIGWIMWFLSMVSFSILVNGMPLGFFPKLKGLMQGELSSLYLFVVTMEALCCMLRKAEEGGFLTTCKIVS